MKKLVMFSLFFCIFISFLSISCNKREKGEEKLQNKENEKDAVDIKNENAKTTEKTIGYAYGVLLAKTINMKHLKIDPKACYKALVDHLDEKDIDTLQYESVLMLAFEEAKAKYALENLEKQNVFLAKNKEVEGIISLESGLQYKILNKGNGKKPLKNGKVKVIYEGKCLGSDVNFDSSNGKEIEMSLENVIEGWKEIIPMMNVGDEFEVYVPAMLAYKEAGIEYRGQEIIPPNALLIFKIKLADVLETQTEEKKAQNE